MKDKQKRTKRQKKVTKPDQRAESKDQSGWRDVLKRLFSHNLDKPASTTEGELWMKINNNE